jgi:hypothetical protein
MNIDPQNLKDEAQALEGSPVAKEVVGNVVDSMTASKIAEVKAKANEFGLGSMVDNLVNAAEEKIGMDLDGDKDIGK